MSLGAITFIAKQGVDAILSVPVHGSRDLPIGTLKSIMKDAELTEEGLHL